MNVRAALVSGVAAGLVSTVAQVALWVTFTDAFPAILWRDTRFAAAILLGSRALESAQDVLLIASAATLIHFVLSFAYALLLAMAIHRRAMPVAIAIGALLGAAVYVVNMHAFTAFFPWFVEARDPITLAAHLVFGVTAVVVYRGLDRRASPIRLRDRNR